MVLRKHCSEAVIQAISGRCQFVPAQCFAQQSSNVVIASSMTVLHFQSVPKPLAVIVTHCIRSMPLSDPDKVLS